MELEKFTENNIIGVVFKDGFETEYEIVEGRNNRVDFLYTKSNGEDGKSIDWSKSLTAKYLNDRDWKFVRRINQEQTFNIWN